MKLPNDIFFNEFLKNNSLNNFGKESRDAALSYVKNFNEVVDIGAHVGISVLHWAEYFKEITAFEPMLDHFNCLEENTKHLSMVNRINCAISNENKILKGAYRTSKNSGSFQLLDDSYCQPSKKDPRKIYNIESKKLDEFNFKSVGLIKIDVEGWELEVLNGAINTINKHRPILLIEFTGGNSKKSLHTYNVEEYYNLIEKLNYISVIKINDDTIYVPKETL